MTGLSRRTLLASVGASALVSAFSSTSSGEPMRIRAPRKSAPLESFGQVDTDISDALAKGIQSGQDVLIVERPSGEPYFLRDMIVDRGGSQVIGIGKPRIIVPHGKTFLKIEGAGSLWSNLIFEPQQMNTTYSIILNKQARGCRLESITIENGNSGIRIEGNHNFLNQIELREMRGTGIRIDGPGAHENTLSKIYIRNTALAGILHVNGAHHNIVRDAHKWVDRSRLTPFLLAQRGMDQGCLGGDICAYTVDCHHNSAFNISCHNPRDGCLTFSGDDNILVGGYFRGGIASGCAISGSRNRVENVTVTECKTGFWVFPQAGGLGKDNVLIDCHAVDCKTFGFRQESMPYRVWSRGAVQKPRTHFCAYELRVYRCSPATEAFGTIPPTHTHGVQSDGLVNWTFIASDPKTLDASGTELIDCTSTRSGVSDWCLEGSGTMIRRSKGSGSLLDSIAAEPSCRS